MNREAMVAPGDRVLVALSGGPDSVALLAALVALAGRFGITVHAAHLNHGLRGADSRRDQQCAEDVARHLGVPCVVGQARLRADQAGLEARARQRRYAFLARVAADAGCTRIATGHTLDDQAETVLMRLLRGTGWDGLTGIHPVREGHIIRPLIDCSRAQVRAFLQARQLPFCEDGSNADPRFLRNRVRHEVLPLLRSFNPEAARHLAAAARHVMAESTLLDAQAGEVLAENADGGLDITALLDAPAGLRPRVVRKWLRTQRGTLRELTAAHIDAVVRLAQGKHPNAHVQLPAGSSVVREYGRLTWAARAAASGLPAEVAHVLVPGTVVCTASGWNIRAEVVDVAGGDWERPRDLWGLVADAQAIAAPLIVRTARPGDRMRLLGLDGHRKLQDLFVDRKLPVGARRTCPVVESAGEILWVPGVARSDRALVTSATRATLRVFAQRAGTGIAGP